MSQQYLKAYHTSYTHTCLLHFVTIVYTTAGGKGSAKPEESGQEMQDNSLYHKHRHNKENEQEFPPEAFESQYEYPPDDNHTVPLRPKPTHPTGPQSDQPPLYDTLNAAGGGRQASTYSSASSRDLPNPLYSGTRPTSQHDSGSGTINGKGGGTEEPLYSEASVPRDNPGVLYSKPDSRGSKLLESFSVEPPVPPDPRTIHTSSPPSNTAPIISNPNEAPTYAEAGPAGSEEHLYSELPNKQTSASSPSHPPPNFHIPPPPPTLPPPSSSSPVLAPEPTYSTPTRQSSQSQETTQ